MEPVITGSMGPCWFAAANEMRESNRPESRIGFQILLLLRGERKA
jgi:hypothetical protein